MLLFSTLLEINDTMTKDSFIQLVLEWNQGSPHEENIIQGIEWNGERNVRYGTETLWLAIEEYRNENIIAVRYEKTEADGVVWDTDYVMNFNDMRMSIQLDRSYLEEALAVDPTFSTPHFITLLIEHGYLKDDGILPMLRKPIFIKADNVDLLTDVINGTSRYRLPVVYISKTYYGEDPVDIWKLSGRLKGVAHVLVEEGTWLNGRIRRQCDNKNEFNGAIGVYFPNSAYGHKKYLYRAYDGIDAVLSEKVIRSVIQYCNALIADDDVVEILTIMESYWMRRAICALPTNTAGPVCISMLKSLNATNQLKSFKANLFSLTWAQRMPSDTEIKDTLKTLKIYSISSSRTKTILDKLENNRRKEYVPTSEYTIEHIMPQTLSDDWKSDLGADANRIHETYVHTIGNLTLTGYNSEYQNKRFSDKVDCTDKAGNAIGYRHTPIKISSYLTTVSKWGEDEILARAEMLSDELITIWKYPKKD